MHLLIENQCFMTNVIQVVISNLITNIIIYENNQ